jgi:nudix-type nucleoside diphosphatase (YffH/AdpP family)
LSDGFTTGEVHLAKHRITAIETLHEGWGKLLKLTIRLPGGEMIDREVEDHGAAVAVLPYDPDRRVVTLVRQFRPPVFHVTEVEGLLEAPAGMLDEDDPAACARREALEEVGLRLRDLEPVGSFWSSPGVSTERMHLFLAPYSESDRVSDGGGLAEEHEDIEVIEVAAGELRTMVERGEVADLKTVALVQALHLRHPDLAGNATESNE